jgi:hypothetical protein
MRRQRGLFGGWLRVLTLLGACTGCSPQTDIGVSPSGGSGEAGHPGGGSSANDAGPGTADGGDPTVAGATGDSATGGSSGSPRMHLGSPYLVERRISAKPPRISTKMAR